LVGLVSLAAAQLTPEIYPAGNFLELINKNEVENHFRNDTVIVMKNNTEAIQFKCQYMDGLDFYDIQPLAIVAEKYGGYFNYSDAKTGASIQVSFCGPLPQPLYCNLQEPSMAVLQLPDDSCVTLSGSNPTENA